MVRYADGRVLKGFSPDFDPDAGSFRLVPADNAPTGWLEVRLADLKAVFFVRSFEGDPAYHESTDLYQARPPATRKVTVEFLDGEVLVGYTEEPDRRAAGLYFAPLDPQSNNLKVFAVFAAISHVRRLL